MRSIYREGHRHLGDWSNQEWRRRRGPRGYITMNGVKLRNKKVKFTIMR